MKLRDGKSNELARKTYFRNLSRILTAMKLNLSCVVSEAERDRKARPLVLFIRCTGVSKRTRTCACNVLSPVSRIPAERQIIISKVNRPRESTMIKERQGSDGRFARRWKKSFCRSRALRLRRKLSVMNRSRI